MTYTKEEIQYIQTVQGATVREIATKLGRSYSSTLSAIIRYNGSFIKTTFNWENEEDLALKEMKEHGEYSLQEMADRIGRSVASVAMRLKLLNLAKPHTQWSADEEKHVITAYGLGLDIKEIAKALNKPVGATITKIKGLRRVGRVK